MCLSGSVCRTGFEEAPMHSVFNTDQYSQSNTNIGLRGNIYIQVVLCPLWKVLSFRVFFSNTFIRWCYIRTEVYKHIFKCKCLSVIFHTLITKIFGVSLPNYYSWPALKLIVFLVDGFKKKSKIQQSYEWPT